MNLSQLLEDDKKKLLDERKRLLLLQSEFIEADEHDRDVELINDASFRLLSGSHGLSAVTIDGNVKILAGMHEHDPKHVEAEFDCRPLGINWIKNRLFSLDDAPIGRLLASYELMIWHEDWEKLYNVGSRMELVKALAAYKYDADVHEAARFGALWRLIRRDPELKHDVTVADLKLILKSHIKSLPKSLSIVDLIG